MIDTSLDSDSPPAQEDRPVIHSWWTEGYKISLEDTGEGRAAIVYRERTDPEDVGEIFFDTAQNRHIIEWNRTGCLALEQYKRDHWDSKFYYTMARWAAS